MLAGNQAPHKIQGMAAAAPGGSEGMAYGRLCAGGNHRVSNVNANSDGDFNFNLGNFENDWDDNNSLLVFRDSNDFFRPPYPRAVVFS